MVIIRQVIVKTIIIISMRIVKPKIWFLDPRIMSCDILANKLLNGSRVCSISSALCRYNWRPVSAICLVMDSSGRGVSKV
ncbi:hypothetical protein CUMW_226160 [Citrus unshiu]|uniref:Uncharacterized protein n=1 Tax=Citrus unshiu TaxID=55188 RepID=A0A2H5QFU6_CITUN|nr:hypothetical protein CUMW_226160 [Citrus unshiu]